jgi:hypothetical protein
MLRLAFRRKNILEPARVVDALGLAPERHINAIGTQRFRVFDSFSITQRHGITVSRCHGVMMPFEKATLLVSRFPYLFG